MLDKAECFAVDGQISVAEAKELWEDVEKAGLADKDIKTLLHAIKVLKFTDKAASFLKPLLDNKKSISSYKQIDGQRLDHDLLDKAKNFARDGRISHAEAKLLWEDVQDGKGVCETGRQTLLYTLSKFRYTAKAALFLRPLIEAGKPHIVYKQIDGLRYDKELLEKALLYAKDGQVSFAEASNLWNSAKDGRKGITAVDRRTLSYSLNKLKYTEKAAAFMRQMLYGGNCADSGKPLTPNGHETTQSTKEKERVVIKWKFVRHSDSYSYPAYPVILPRKEHLFSLVLCHPMGCYSTFFLGPCGLVKDLLLGSRQIRDHCKILCPGARKIGWGKQWFPYRTNRGGTPRCHAEEVGVRDLQKAIKFVSSVVDGEVQQLGSPSRVFIGGYSQGGSMSLAVGLSLPYDLGLVISQRGMLMKQTMDLYNNAGARIHHASVDSQRHHLHRRPSDPLSCAKPRILMTAGLLDDVFLIDNQRAGESWLQKHGCIVDFKVLHTLDHYENSRDEHKLIRRACLVAFQRSNQVATSTKRASVDFKAKELERASPEFESSRKRHKHSPGAAVIGPH